MALDTHGEAPHALAGTDLGGRRRCRRRAGDHQPLSVDGGDDRLRVIGSARGGRLGPPDNLAGPLVEGDLPVGPLGLIAPARVDHAEDDEVLIDDRAGDAAAVTGDSAKLLAHRFRPDDLPVLVEADEEPLGAVGVDIAGDGIGRQIRPAEPTGDDVGVKDGERVFPHFLAGFGLEAHDALDDRLGHVLEFIADFDLGGVVVDDVNKIVQDDGRRAATGLSPNDVAVDLVGQVLIRRNAGLPGAAPVRPVRGRRVRCSQGGDENNHQPR